MAPDLDLALGTLDQEPGSDTFSSAPPDSDKSTIVSPRFQMHAKSEDALVIINTATGQHLHLPSPREQQQQHGTYHPSRLTYIVDPFTTRHLGRRRETKRKSPICCCCSPPELPLSPSMWEPRSKAHRHTLFLLRCGSGRDSFLASLCLNQQKELYRYGSTLPVCVDPPRARPNKPHDLHNQTTPTPSQAPPLSRIPPSPLYPSISPLSTPRNILDVPRVAITTTSPSPSPIGVPIRPSQREETNRE